MKYIKGKQLCWQGEPVDVEFVECLVSRKKEKPMFWYNYECRELGRALIPAVRVTTKAGYSFLLSNHYGIAIHKLINGGWPTHIHFGLDGAKAESSSGLMDYEEFLLEAYEEHEKNRSEWQKKNFPDLYERKEAILSIAKRRYFTNP